MTRRGLPACRPGLLPAHVQGCNLGLQAGLQRACEYVRDRPNPAEKQPHSSVPANTMYLRASSQVLPESRGGLLP